MTTRQKRSSSILVNPIMQFTLVLGLFCTISCLSSVMAQDTTSVEEEPSGFKSRMALTATQMADGSIELDALLRVKAKESYEVVPNAKVSFINVTPEGDEKHLGEMYTGMNGKAIFKVKAADMSPDADGYLSFLARYDGDDKIKSSETDLRIHPALLTAEAVEEDSTYIIKLHASADSPEGPVPIPEAAVSVYVRRMFSSLKVAEGATDEEGNVEIEFPNDLPGDQEANLDITAMIEESEEYGNLAVSLTKKWGYAVMPGSKELPRALWSPHPPAWMVVTFFILMVMVWGNYVIIIFKLFRIRFKKDHVPQ
jgi:hypothetical protein